MSYPVSFRRHALSIREQEGLSFEETSKRFGVGIASLKCWSKRLHPKPCEHRKIRKIDLKKLAQDVRDHPDASQYERAAGGGACRGQRHLPSACGHHRPGRTQPVTCHPTALT
ncbi:MAG: transposase [Rhodobacterales bacterium]|nr:MAG: transposase [Rhodobacterales bacterium]